MRKNASKRMKTRLKIGLVVLMLNGGVVGGKGTDLEIAMGRGKKLQDF